MILAVKELPVYGATIDTFVSYMLGYVFCEIRKITEGCGNHHFTSQAFTHKPVFE